jgi:DNA-binding MarR family transcriptional regulator
VPATVKDLDARLAEAFSRIVNRTLLTEKRSYGFGIPERFHTSEIHLIDAVGKNPGSSISATAAFLGITRGAVWQMLRKLTPTHVIEKKRAPDNRRDVQLFLTAKGSRVFENHNRFHETQTRTVAAQLVRLSKDCKKAVLLILSELEKAMSR